MRPSGAGPTDVSSENANPERLVYVMSPDGPSADEIDLLEIWRILWSGKWIIIGVSALFAITAIVYALLATEWYRAEVLLAPAEERSTSGLAAQFGGLASLAGITVGGGGTIEPIAVLNSREFARALIEDLDLITVLLKDKWDPEAQRWRESDPQKWPDIRDAIKYFEENVLTVNEDPTTGLVTLAIEWTDAETAAGWANLLVARLNDRMRARALAEAESNIEFLRTEIAATNVVTLQQSISRLLEAEMQKLMLARGNQEFTFRVIDSAQPPKLRARPKRTLIVIAATLLGGVIGILVVFVGQLARGRPAT